MQIFISDGTTTVYFAGSNTTRFKYRGWSPQVAQYKGGGIFHDSPVSDGRRLVSAAYENPTEAISFNVVSVSGDTGQDDAADDIRELMALIEQANEYWFDDTGQIRPVYLGVQGTNAANTQYALLHFATVPELGDVADIVWEQVHMLDLTLLVERSHWLQNTPGGSSAVAITSGKNYNSQTLGFQTEDSSGNIVVGNAHTVANITHCYYFNGTATYTDYLAGGTVSFSGGTSDYLLFGVQASAPNASYPINVGLLAPDGQLLPEDHTKPVFERNVGGTWESITDSTLIGTDLSVTGEPWGQAQTLFIGLESRGGTPASATINSVDAYWVRLRLSSVLTGSESYFVISSGGFKSAILPYFTIDSGEIKGELPALFHVTAATNFTNGVLFGARRTGRGSGFQSHINLTTITKDQNEAGISVALGSMVGAQSVLGDSVTGYGIANSGTVTSTDFLNLATVTVASTVSRDFDGYYRAFLAGENSADPTNTLFARLRTSVGGDVKTYIAPLISTVTNVNSWTASVSQSLWDFGIIQLSTRNPFSTDAGPMTLSVDVTQESGVTTKLYSLILIPVDEWSLDISVPLDEINSSLADFDNTTTITSGGQLIASSLTDMRRPAVGVAYDGGSFMSNAIARASNVGAFSPGVEYNVYSLIYYRGIDSSGSAVYSFYRPYGVAAITVKKNQRYKALRGSV